MAVFQQCNLTGGGLTEYCLAVKVFSNLLPTRDSYHNSHLNDREVVLYLNPCSLESYLVGEMLPVRTMKIVVFSFEKNNGSAVNSIIKV